MKIVNISTYYLAIGRPPTDTSGENAPVHPFPLISGPWYDNNSFSTLSIHTPAVRVVQT